MTQSRKFGGTVLLMHTMQESPAMTELRYELVKPHIPDHYRSLPAFAFVQRMLRSNSRLAEDAWLIPISTQCRMRRSMVNSCSLSQHTHTADSGEQIEAEYAMYAVRVRSFRGFD
ncbi:MAG: hypothetical protein MHM6MM_002986 [Cercozoa sp. M6MM]